jgi:hypothetical protein
MDMCLVLGNACGHCTVRRPACHGVHVCLSVCLGPGSEGRQGIDCLSVLTSIPSALPARLLAQPLVHPSLCQSPRAALHSPGFGCVPGLPELSVRPICLCACLCECAPSSHPPNHHPPRIPPNHHHQANQMRCMWPAQHCWVWGAFFFRPIFWGACRIFIPMLAEFQVIHRVASLSRAAARHWCITECGSCSWSAIRVQFPVLHVE